jgi:hypothetical protein
MADKRGGGPFGQTQGRLQAPLEKTKASLGLKEFRG